MPPWVLRDQQLPPHCVSQRFLQLFLLTSWDQMKQRSCSSLFTENQAAWDPDILKNVTETLPLLWRYLLTQWDLLPHASSYVSYPQLPVPHILLKKTILLILQEVYLGLFGRTRSAVCSFSLFSSLIYEGDLLQSKQHSSSLYSFTQFLQVYFPRRPKIPVEIDTTSIKAAKAASWYL